MAAHYAAAQFLVNKGDINSAIDHYREALSFAPDNLGLLLNLAALYLRQSQFSAAMEPLEHARHLSPDSADVAKLMGWAYYGANKMDQAVAEWKLAEKLRPDPEVQHALEKAERDKTEEESYREGETANFDLKYNGSATPDLARGILHVLEDDFRDLESQLDYTPPEPIGVILYTGQSFADITRAPSWVGALNDGRMRIPVQGLSSVTPDLARVLRHELTHSFIAQKTHNRAPTWLQEGVAQYVEGRRTSDSAGALSECGKPGSTADARRPRRILDGVIGRVSSTGLRLVASRRRIHHSNWQHRRRQPHTRQHRNDFKHRASPSRNATLRLRRSAATNHHIPATRRHPLNREQLRRRGATQLRAVLAP